MSSRARPSSRPSPSSPRAPAAPASPPSAPPSPAASAPRRPTPELIAQLCACLRLGAYLDTAAAACGLPLRTLQTWLDRASALRPPADAAGPRRRPRRLAARDRPYADLLAAIEQAVAQSELDDLAAIRTASSRHWHAAAWHLERKHPERWSRDPQKSDAPASGPTVAIPLTDAEQDALLQRHYARTRAHESVTPSARAPADTSPLAPAPP